MVTVRVHPRASRAKVERNGEVIEVWVTGPPVEGAANRAVLRAIAGELRVPVSALRLRSGLRSRTKTIEVIGR